MMLAVKEGLNRGYETFVIYGGLGGRLDHTIANIQTLSYIAKKGAAGYLAGSGMVITAVKDSTITFTEKHQGYISIFCSGKDAEGVCIEGLKYKLDKATLSSSFPIGVSNEFIGKESAVSVADGTIIILWYDNDFIAGYGKWQNL